MMRSFGYIQEFYSNENKHISPAFAVGLAADVAPFNTEWDTTILKGRSSKRYVSGKMMFGFNLHFGTKTLASSSTQKFFFDIGFIYKLPILFLHTAARGTTTVKRYFIHQFTDSAVTTRIGYGEVAISAEYRLFDYLLGKFPELPRLRFGLSFPFAAF